MKRHTRILAALFMAATSVLAQQSPESALRRALLAKTGTVVLPGGIVEITREIVLPADAHDLSVQGAETTIKAAAGFRGRALIVIPAGKNLKIANLSLDGNRGAFPQPVSPAPPAAVLSRVVAGNGILAEDVTGLEISQVNATGIPGFPIVVNAGHHIRIHDVEITESGTLDADGHNNGSGGILLEEGVTDFEILHALIGKVRGNGIWIRSATDPGAVPGVATAGRIAECEFAILGRAAIELNHATGITIENNIAHMIGFPGDEVLTGGTALPAAIATTGGADHASVKNSAIRNNDFGQLAGRCLSLDGFSDGEVAGNQCSDGLFNAFLIRGTGNRITGNHLSGLNNARRDQPESLRAGIYLATGASGNTVEANDIAGYGMAQHCVGGPGAAANKVAKNLCSDGSSVARLQPAIVARLQPAIRR